MSDTNMSKTTFRKTSSTSNRRKSSGSASSEKKHKSQPSLNISDFQVQSCQTSYGSQTESNVQDEVVLYLYTSLLENIVDEWYSAPLTPSEDELSMTVDRDDNTTGRSLKGIGSEESQQMKIVATDDSKASLKKKKPRKSLSGSKSLTSSKQKLSDSKTKVSKDRKRSSGQSQGSRRRSSTSSIGDSVSMTSSAQQSPSYVYSGDVRKDSSKLLELSKPVDEIVTIKLKNGNTYTGEVYRKVMHGKGEYHWNDGTVYKGEFVDGYPTGEGHLTLPNLCTYQGNFCKGLFYGKGTLHVSGSEKLYSGNWKYGKKHGKGWLLYETGNWYEGDWSEDLRDGFGCRRYSSGAMYKGFWKDGLQHGPGTMCWGNNDFYKGEWSKGQRNGYGEYTWNAFYNPTFTFPLENQYLGSWISGKRSGVGIMHFGMDGGSKLAGIWASDLKHGPGVLICGNGFAIEKNPLFVKDKPVHMQFSAARFAPTMQDSIRKLSISSKQSSLQLISGQVMSKKAAKNVSRLALESIRDSHQELKRILCTPIELPIYSAVETVDLTYFMKVVSDEFAKRECRYVRRRNSQESLRNDGELFLVKTEHLSLDDDAEIIEEKICESHCLINYAKEEKELRTLITVSLPKLEKIYNNYATITCATNAVNFKPILVRLFLWQFWKDTNVLKNRISLADIDLLLDNNTNNGFESLHNPFEKVYFWQFLQSLISIAWHLNIKQEMLVINKDGLLANAFKIFLDDYIFQPLQYSRSSCLFEYKDLLPFQSVYLFYKNLGEPLTAREFLNKTCVKKGMKPPCYLKSMEVIYKKFEPGTNCVTVGNNIIYVPDDPPDIGEKPEEPACIDRKDAYYKDLVTFRRLGPQKIMECLSEVCPGIIKDGLIVNMEYAMVFLEFYEVFILCALKTIEKKIAKRSGIEEPNEINEPSPSSHKLSVVISKMNTRRSSRQEQKKGKTK